MRRLLGIWAVLLIVGGLAVAVQRQDDPPTQVAATGGPAPDSPPMTDEPVAASTTTTTTTAASTTAPPTAAPTASTTMATTTTVPATPTTSSDHGDPAERSTPTTVPPEWYEGERLVVTQTPTGSTGPTTRLESPAGGYPAGTVLTGDATIRGHLRFPDGRAPTRVCVELWGYTEWTGPTASFVVDGGDFTAVVWMHVPEDGLGVSIRDCSGSLPGFAKQWVSILVGPLQTKDVPITVDVGSGFEGRLRDYFTGNVVTGHHCIGMLYGNVQHAVWTAADGSYAIGGIPAGGNVSATVYRDDGPCSAIGPHGTEVAYAFFPVGAPGTMITRDIAWIVDPPGP